MGPVLRTKLVAAPIALTLVLVGCTDDAEPDPPASASPSTDGALADTGVVDVGGYELAYQCAGARTEGPTVVMEAGYDSAGTSTWLDLQPDVAEFARVCTYDRAGVGTSDPRPSSMEPVTGGQIAGELHALLQGIDETGPCVLVGHSFGGLLVRTFGANYPDEVAGMVLIDASSEPEIPIYRRLHAGAWIDGGTKVDIDEVSDEVRHARLGEAPLVVLTAEVLEDEWLSQVPDQAAQAQARLATLSTNAVQVLAPDTGHFIQDEVPALVLEAIRQVEASARTGKDLPPCGTAFEDVGGECIAPGEIPTLVTP
jgi:pimeloyl-ACP methyl ester carboxylesterase